MSSATGPSIFTNSRARWSIVATGLVAGSVQVFFLREFLTVFYGSELIIGIVLGLWLFAVSLGSYFGSRRNGSWNETLFFYLVCCGTIFGFVALRASRRLFSPGEMVEPGQILLIVASVQSVSAFLCGFAFGRLSILSRNASLFAFENLGAILGLVVVTIGIVLHISTSIMIVIALFLSALGMVKSLRFLAGAGLLFTVVIASDPITLSWKYPFVVDSIKNGSEGEIAIAATNGTRRTFINGTLYRQESSLPDIEQAVHLPIAMMGWAPRRALIIHDAGYGDELKKYHCVDIVCLESEPLLAAKHCACSPVESFQSKELFDCIISGAAIPTNGTAGRFFTRSFFFKMKSMLKPDGVFSFSLPLGETMLSKKEQLLSDVLIRTLASVFSHTMIIPGAGYTFVASDKPLIWPVKLLAKAEYLENYTLMSLAPARIAEVNKKPPEGSINTTNHPMAIMFAQEAWLSLFGLNAIYIFVLFAALVVAIIFVLPKTGGVFSVGSSGFTIGVYTCALLLIYQYTHGTIYSNISVLFIALSFGFAAGGFVKRFRFSDLVISLYAVSTLLFISRISAPPYVLFMVLLGGMGLLSGAQFASRQDTEPGALYAADCAGGILGMALSTSCLIPLWGITNTAIAVGTFKLMVSFASWQKRK